MGITKLMAKTYNLSQIWNNLHNLYKILINFYAPAAPICMRSVENGK